MRIAHRCRRTAVALLAAAPAMLCGLALTRPDLVEDQRDAAALRALPPRRRS